MPAIGVGSIKKSVDMELIVQYQWNFLNFNLIGNIILLSFRFRFTFTTEGGENFKTNGICCWHQAKLNATVLFILCVL